MKCCDEHWGALRRAIDDRGMSHLVSKNSKEAEENWNNQENGIELTDPLMLCFVMVVNEAIAQGGPEMALPDEKGELKCPVCEAIRRTPEPEAKTEDNWINGPADEVLKTFREKRLLPQLQ